MKNYKIVLITTAVLAVSEAVVAGIVNTKKRLDKQDGRILDLALNKQDRFEK